MAINAKFELVVLQGLYLGDSSSGKAFNIRLFNSKGKEEKNKWFPHSQVKLADSKAKVTGGHKEPIRIGVPMWMVESEGLEHLCREDLLDKEYGEQVDIDDDIPF